MQAPTFDSPMPLESAQERILAELPAALCCETLDLTAALGRVAAVPIIARRALPPFANSAMDGYAVRSLDVQRAPVSLPLQGMVQAGASELPALLPGHCLRIFTGAPLPPGSDAVVMQEHTRPRAEPGKHSVHFDRAATRGQHVRQAGEDVAVGQTLVQAGQPLRPGELGMLAAQGQSWIKATRLPRVAILPTGDELRPMDAALAPGEIVESNSLMLAALVRQAGGIAWCLPPVADSPQALRQAIQQAAHSADLVLTCGGVSVGDFDLVRQVLQELGDIDFWRVAIKPGKPLAFGHVRDTPLIGLPGNPVSSFVCFELFARPALRRLAGHLQPLRPRRAARLHTPLPGGQRRTLWRVHLHREGEALWASPLAQQGSGSLSSLLAVDALLDAPARAEPFAANTALPVLVLDPDC